MLCSNCGQQLIGKSPMCRNCGAIVEGIIPGVAYYECLKCGRISRKWRCKNCAGSGGAMKYDEWFVFEDTDKNGRRGIHCSNCGGFEYEWTCPQCGTHYTNIYDFFHENESYK